MKKQVISAAIFVFLAIALVAGLILVSRSQEIRKKAAGSGASKVELSVYPLTDTFKLNETKTFELKAIFTDGSSSEHLDYFRTEVNFPKDYLQLPAGVYADVSRSGFGKIFRVDGPTAANDSGKIVIELGANGPGTGPTTDKAITIAKLSFQAKNPPPTPNTTQLVTFSAANSTQVVNNQANKISVTSQTAKFTLTDQSASPTPTDITASPSAILATPTPIATCITLPKSETFDNGAVDTDFWGDWLAGSNSSTDVSSGAMVASAGNIATSSNAGMITKNRLCGDFDARVDVSQFTSGILDNAVAMLSIEETGTGSAVYTELHNNGKSQGFETDMRLNGVWQNQYKEFKSSATAGSLRIRRSGGIISTFYKTGADWQLLNTFSSANIGDVNLIMGVGSWDPGHPSVSASFDNLSITAPLPDNVVTIAPVTSTPSGILSGSPTPPSGRDKYTIDVGNKQWLSINIGPAVTPQVRFKAKLANVSKYPDMYMRLRVKDDLYFTNANIGTTNDMCNNPPNGTYDFWVPVKADANGVYSPVLQNSAPAPNGRKIATVSSDGWVLLDGVSPGRYYSLYLKSPKTTSSLKTKHVILQPNQNTQTQDFDWTADDMALEPGDLPDPNNGLKQDCVVNAVDISLITSRLGATDQAALNIADVNYDGVVNGSDISKVVDTLSHKPDDDI